MSNERTGKWLVCREFDCIEAHKVIARFKTKREASEFSLHTPRTYVTNGNTYSGSVQALVKREQA